MHAVYYVIYEDTFDQLFNHLCDMVIYSVITDFYKNHTVFQGHPKYLKCQVLRKDDQFFHNFYCTI